ncbi:MAG TPA: hypothetical protein VL475_14815, partial [Planctomycetaceae bacterium]|nr:hypothetical protein [Planctomycetaceae bacterium]
MTSLSPSPRLVFAAYCLLDLSGIVAEHAASAADPASDKGKASLQRGAEPASLKAARLRAIDFLRTTQNEDGSWTSPTAPGVSGLVTAAILRSGVKNSDPVAQKAVKHLSSFVQEDGG